MTQPQRPKDGMGSRTQEETGKKPATEPKGSPREMNKRTVTENLTDFVAQDDQEMEEFGYESEEDESQSGEQNDDAESAESIAGEDAHDEAIDQEELTGEEGYEDDDDDQSSDSEEDPGTDSSDEEDQESSDEEDEELVESTVQKLSACVERTDKDRYEIAKGIVDNFLNGDIKAASDKNPWKTKSLKKLRDHRRLPIGSRRLGDWIRAYGCWAEINARDPKIAPGFSTALELIAIADEDKRFELALEIYNKRLSVRKTRKRVLEIKAKGVDPKLVARLLAKIKDPRSIPLPDDYQKMIKDEQYLSDELSKKERLLLRAEIDTKRDQMSACGQFLDLLEQRLSDIDL